MLNENQTPAGPDEVTPKGTENEEESATGIVLQPEEEEDFRHFQEIKKTTGFTKFSESAKEAIRLAQIVATPPAPMADATLSDEELKRLDPNYEFMDEKEKSDFKEKIATKKRLMVLEAKEMWREDFKRLPETVRSAINKKGGEEAFKAFSILPENLGVKNLATLAKAFIFDEQSLENKPTPPKPKNPGLETPSGGDRKPSDMPAGSMTSEQASQLRQNDPRRYNELVSTGRLKIVDKK